MKKRGQKCNRLFPKIFFDHLLDLFVCHVLYFNFELAMQIFGEFVDLLARQSTVLASSIEAFVLAVVGLRFLDSPFFTFFADIRGIFPMRLVSDHPAAACGTRLGESTISLFFLLPFFGTTAVTEVGNLIPSDVVPDRVKAEGA